MKIGAVVLLLLLLTVMTGYLVLVHYYQDNFMLNTWINGVYCTGKTVEQVNAELLAAKREYPEELAVTMLYAGGEDNRLDIRSVSYEEIGYRVDYTGSLRDFLQKQDVWLWMDGLFEERHYAIDPSGFYEEELLREWWESSGGIAEKTGQMQDCVITYQGKEGGYVFYDGMKNILDEERAYRLVQEAIQGRHAALNLVETDCYSDLPYTEEQRWLQALWERLRVYQEGGFSYDFGDESLFLDAGLMASFLEKEEEPPYLPVADESGGLQISQEAVRTFVDWLADEYDTYQREWHFTSTAGEEITLQGGTYGTQMNREAEALWLSDYLNRLVAGESETASQGPLSPDLPEGQEQASAEEPAVTAGLTRIPEYKREAYCRNRSNWGGTYVEVDMGAQHLYYYEDGELKLETDIVTGKGGRTPEGVNFVYSKQRNRILRGPGYASPVSYWMPVTGNIGIHDASWRSEFGGDIYLRSGSHGCINIPKAVMPDIYEMVGLGTPVIMFYGEK